MRPMVSDHLPLLWEVTIGPDGTVLGRLIEDGRSRPFSQALDLMWIEAAWRLPRYDVTPALCMMQDGLGRPGMVPPGLDYIAAIRASSRRARRQMLEVVRAYIPDEEIAGALGIKVAALRELIDQAYPSGVLEDE